LLVFNEFLSLNRNILLRERPLWSYLWDTWKVYGPSVSWWRSLFLRQ